MEQTASVQDRWNFAENSLQSAGAATCAEAARVQREVAALIHERSLPPRVRPLKIACLRSVTVEPVLPLIVAAMAARDFAATVELGQFGNHAGEMLSPDSFVARGDFDVCLVLVPLRVDPARLRATPSPESGRRGPIPPSVSGMSGCPGRALQRIDHRRQLRPPPTSLLARRFQSQTPSALAMPLRRPIACWPTTSGRTPTSLSATSSISRSGWARTISTAAGT